MVIVSQFILSLQIILFICLNVTFDLTCIACFIGILKFHVILKFTYFVPESEFILLNRLLKVKRLWTVMVCYIRSIWRLSK